MCEHCTRPKHSNKRINKRAPPKKGDAIRTWVRDLAADGDVETNPGPTMRIIGKNVDGISTTEGFDEAMYKI